MAAGEYTHRRDVETLKAALRTLKREEGIGSEKLLAEFHAQHPRLKGVEEISRQAFDKFLSGENILRPTRCRALYEWLRDHDDGYRRHLDDAAPAPDAAASVGADAFAATVAGFFTDARVPPTFASPVSLRRLFAGQFVLYRPDWSARHGAGFHRVSMLDITAGDNGCMQLTETQDFPDETPQLFQTATGTLFSYGPFAYFLLREDEPAGRRVMFGGFKEAHPAPDLVPHEKSAKVQWFSGFVGASSIHGMSAREPFVCRRRDPKQPARVGVMKLNEGNTDAETLGLLQRRPPWL